MSKVGVHVCIGSHMSGYVYSMWKCVYVYMCICVYVVYVVYVCTEDE